MWYRRARRIQAQFGGGVVYKPKAEPNKALDNTIQQSLSAQGSPDETSAKIWDTLVDVNDHIGSHKGSPNVTEVHSGPEYGPVNEGPATEAEEMRRLSPVHSNPEEATWEEKLEAVRHQNVNNPNTFINQTNMGQASAAQGEMAVKGLPQYNQGKGADVFMNDNRSSIQTFAK